MESSPDEGIADGRTAIHLLPAAPDSVADSTPRLKDLHTAADHIVGGHTLSDPLHTISDNGITDSTSLLQQLGTSPDGRIEGRSAGNRLIALGKHIALSPSSVQHLQSIDQSRADSRTALKDLRTVDKAVF
jgi:hypothetical protein